jgi:hypothetical protein
VDRANEKSVTIEKISQSSRPHADTAKDARSTSGYDGNEQDAVYSADDKQSE